jgi:O-antigen ligase
VIHLGVTGALGFAFFSFLGIAGANIGIALMLVAAILDRQRFWPALRGDLVLWLLLWTLLAVGLSTGMRIWQFPEEAAPQWDGLLDVLQLYLFILVAWWLQGQQRLIVLSLTLALFGFLLGVYRALDAETLRLLFALHRPHFIWSINAFGQYAAASLLGMALFTPRLWRWLAIKRWRWAGMLGWTTLMGLAGAGVVLSLSRGVWLASTLVVAGLVSYLGWTHRRDRTIRRGLVISGVLGLALLAGTFALSQGVRTRALAIAQPMLQLWTARGRLEEMSDDYDRLRARLLVLGWQSWEASPWFGAGPAGSSQILKANFDQSPDGKTFADFHNLAVDMLASFGVVGSLPLLLTFVLVINIAHRGYRAGRLDQDAYLTVVSLLALSALAQMTDTRILSSHGRFYSMLLAGAGYSWWLNARSVRADQLRPSA